MYSPHCALHKLNGLEIFHEFIYLFRLCLSWLMFHSNRAFIFLAVGWLNVFHFLYWNFEFIYVAFQIYTAYYDLSKYMLLMSRYLCVCRILSSTKREFDSRQSSTLPWLHNHFGFNDCPVILMQTASLFHAYFISICIWLWTIFKPSYILAIVLVF